MTTTKNILICDFFNIFCRHYSANPTINSSGESVGGIVGTLKFISNLVSLLKPTHVYIIWEQGGSKKRKALYPEYKANRAKPKTNRFYEQDIPDTDENKAWQLQALIKIINSTPLCQLYVQDAEADDVIGALCQNRFKNDFKTIVSSDRDFYQLLNDKTKIYSPTKKGFVVPEDVKKEFGISVANFAVAKAICGDRGDNVLGVERIGFKTLIKILPILGLDQPLLLDEVFSYIHAHVSEQKKFPIILQNEVLVRRNWKLVYLSEMMMTIAQLTKINQAIDNFKPQRNQIEFMKQLLGHGINNFDMSYFFGNLGSVNNLA